MTFNDIFKSSFLENVTAVSLTDMVLALTLSSDWDCLSTMCTARPTQE